MAMVMEVVVRVMVGETLVGGGIWVGMWGGRGTMHRGIAIKGGMAILGMHRRMLELRAVRTGLMALMLETRGVTMGATMGEAMVDAVGVVGVVGAGAAVDEGVHVGVRRLMSWMG